MCKADDGRCPECGKTDCGCIVCGHEFGWACDCATGCFVPGCPAENRVSSAPSTADIADAILSKDVARGYEIGEYFFGSPALKEAIKIQRLFGKATQKEVEKHFEAGSSVHGVVHGWLVEVKPIKKMPV